jgi:hydrogenase nickel incorporation protein HypA/HybF
MHEFALAEEIILTLEKKLAGDFVKVTSLYIDVGAFSGVVLESLQFGLELILKDRGLPETKVKLKLVPARVTCECGEKYSIQSVFEACPTCSSLNRAVDTGTDILIQSVDLAEE